jgi:hypothetical protein
MHKIKAVLLGLALTVPAVMAGCDPAVASATEGIEIVSVDLKDWKNPADGKEYLVAMPTWKNNGKDAVRQVTFVAEIQGEEAQQPTIDPTEPQFYGAIVEPGTQVDPQRIPEDGVVLGEKDHFKDLDPSKVKIRPFASPNEFVPPPKDKP